MLAAFAISALSVQNLDAQNPVKKPTTTEKKVEKKDDCCADKKVSGSEKQMKADCKKECKHGDKKCDAAKKETATDK